MVRKTWTALNKCNSSINISKGNPVAYDIVSIDRNYAFVGNVPRPIDEWQDMPDIRDATKIKVDESYLQAHLYPRTRGPPTVAQVGSEIFVCAPCLYSNPEIRMALCR